MLPKTVTEQLGECILTVVIIWAINVIRSKYPLGILCQICNYEAT